VEKPENPRKCLSKVSLDYYLSKAHSTHELREINDGDEADQKEARRAPEKA
jgi:hypothetical protein